TAIDPPYAVIFGADTHTSAAIATLEQSYSGLEAAMRSYRRDSHRRRSAERQLSGDGPVSAQGSIAVVRRWNHFGAFDAQRALTGTARNPSPNGRTWSPS